MILTQNGKINMRLHAKKLLNQISQNQPQYAHCKKMLFRKKMLSFNENMPIQGIKRIHQQLQQPKLIHFKRNVWDQRSEQLIELDLNDITFYPKGEKKHDFRITSQRKKAEISKNNNQKNISLQLTFMKPLPMYQQLQQPTLSKIKQANSSRIQRKRPQSVASQRGSLKKRIDHIQKKIVNQVYKKRALSVFLKQRDLDAACIQKGKILPEEQKVKYTENEFLLSNCLQNNKPKNLWISKKRSYPKKHQFSFQAAQL